MLPTMGSDGQSCSSSAGDLDRPLSADRPRGPRVRGAPAAVLVLVLALAVAGCGGADGDESATASESPRVTASAPATAGPVNGARSGEDARKGPATRTARPSTSAPPSAAVPPATNAVPASKTTPAPGPERRGKRSPLTGTRRPAASPYELRPTVTCLRRRGAVVGRVSGDDATLRSIRDLAQRTSRSVTLRGETAWLAVGKSVAEAQLLIELLALPGQPYDVARHGNAVVIRRSGSVTTSKAAVACLRP